MNPLVTLGLPTVGEDLARFEPLLAESVVIGDSYLDQVTTHLIRAGGKRLRPLLAIASATGGVCEASQDDLLGAIALELMHLASLYHDDVMDEAEIRRNVDSVNARFGNVVAIVAGDYLMARSAAIAADLGTNVAALLARTLASLTRGQVSEVRTAFDVTRTFDDYVEAIGGKTATLMASSCRVGAITAGRTPAEVDALGHFGHAFGMVFQIRDDLLDLVAVDGQLGKPTGQDLSEGIYTLPVLVALEDASAGDELRGLLGKPLEEPEREKARALVTSTNGVVLALREGERWAELAHDALAGVHEPGLRAGLGALVSSLLAEVPAAQH
ncbi:MAG TPA: polyprenyl synthetase family protein [Acidimicrobiales bacterium]|nr:polyprenyl synthetase family protein [Acidimicrobiales bacterium]